MIMEVGRVCRKLKGRDAGEYCVVVEKVDDAFVVVEGKGMKKTKTSVFQLEPLPSVITVKKGEKTEDIIKALEKELA